MSDAILVYRHKNILARNNSRNREALRCVFSIVAQFRDAIDYAPEAPTFFELISISAANVTVSELYERLRDFEILIRFDR